MELSNKSNDAVSIKAEDTLLSQSQSPPSSSNERSRPLQHPLLNPLIVNLIVEHLDPNFEQLKALRLVSKVWIQATHNRWRNSCAVLTIVPDPHYFCRSIYTTGVSISTLMKEFQNPESLYQLSQKPYSKYKLKDFTLDLELCGGDRSGLDSPAHKFWNEIGPLMKSMHFYKCLFEGTEAEDSSNSNAICPRVQFLARLIPNLEDLGITEMTDPEARKFWGDESSDEDELSDGTDKIKDLKVGDKQSPYLNLRTLTIYGDWRNNRSLSQLLMFASGLEVIKGECQYLRTLLKPIHGVRYPSAGSMPRPLSNLKNVDLVNSRYFYHGHFPSDLANPLEGSQVPLETLSLHLGAFGEDTENLDIYLKSLSTTLKTFKGLRAPAGPPYSNFLANASMTQLTELEFMGTIAPNIEFLMSTPNLKKLRIDLSCFEKRQELKDLIKHQNIGCHENWKYEKYQDDMVVKVAEDLKDEILCTELEHFEIDFEFPEESLRLLGKWMPNLEILKTILNVETVPVVCEIWNDLHELRCLYGSKIKNCCFIRPEEKTDFPGNPSELKISDLKDLERFQLDAYCDDCNLTDDVVYKGLLKMPNLKFIEICANSQMSAEAEDALKNGIQFCKVVRDNHDDCGGLASFTNFSFLCDRCAFRDEVYGVGGKDEDGDSIKSEESEEDSDGGIFIELGLGPQSVDSNSESDASSSSSGSASSDSGNSVATV